tara:strand:+ start:25452 stop:25784 length:333 start_codon:yes stop_codon:yes gene_type:complete
MVVESEELPDWWIENQSIKSSMDLPVYDPPRFEDGIYTHTIVPVLEEELGCKILFIGIDVKYPDDWEIRIDDIPVCGIKKYRTQEANTIYGVNSEKFREMVRREMGERVA